MTWLREHQPELQSSCFDEALAHNATWRSIDETTWLTEYQGRELDFATEVLGYRFPGTDVSTLWQFQQDALRELFEHHFVTIRGPRACGKSELLGGVVVPTFFSTAPSQILLLGPTEHQMYDNVWTKTRTGFLQATRKLPGEMHVKFWRIPEDEQCFAKILAAKTPENVRGAHSGRNPPIPEGLDEELLEIIEKATKELARGKRRLLIAVDEANSLSQETYRVIEGMLSADNVYVYLQANPLMDAMETEHYYCRSHHPGSRFKKFRVSAISDERISELGGGPDQLEADYTYEGVPTELCKTKWIEEQLRLYEIDDPVLCSDVLGRFSTGNLSTLVLPRWVMEQALVVEPDYTPPAPGEKRTLLPKFEGPSVGVDIGITHDNCAAVFMWDGEVVDYLEWLPGRGDQEAQVSIAERIIALAWKWGRLLFEVRPDRWARETCIPGGRIHIDTSGLVGVADFCASKGLYVDRVQFGAGPGHDWPDLVGDVEMANRRASMAWASRRLLQEGIVRVPRKFDRIWREAGWVKFARKARAKGLVLQLEPKDDVRERHGRSPDALDAFWLACCEPQEGPVFRGRRRVRV